MCVFVFNTTPNTFNTTLLGIGDEEDVSLFVLWVFVYLCLTLQPILSTQSDDEDVSEVLVELRFRFS